MVNIDKWMKRITWTSFFLLLIILLINITGFVYYRFYPYYQTSDAILYTGDSFISPYKINDIKPGIYYINPNIIYNSPILDYIGKIIWASSFCSMLTFYFREAWIKSKEVA